MLAYLGLHALMEDIQREGDQAAARGTLWLDRAVYFRCRCEEVLAGGAVRRGNSSRLATWSCVPFRPAVV